MGMIQYKVKILANNSVAGPDGDSYVYIQPKGVCRHIEFAECAPDTYAGGAFAGEGLRYKLPFDNFQQVFPLVPGATQIINDLVEEANAGGRMIGHPQVGKPGMVNYNPATIIAKVSSGTVNATQILVTEYS